MHSYSHSSPCAVLPQQRGGPINSGDWPFLQHRTDGNLLRKQHHSHGSFLATDVFQRQIWQILKQIYNVNIILTENLVMLWLCMCTHCAVECRRNDSNHLNNKNVCGLLQKRTPTTFMANIKSKAKRNARRWIVGSFGLGSYSHRVVFGQWHAAWHGLWIVAFANI